jgi:hypothetical protein
MISWTSKNRIYVTDLPSVPRIALVRIPEIKANLIEHLVPSLENQIAEVIQPLKQDILHLIMIR